MIRRIRSALSEKCLQTCAKMRTQILLRMRKVSSGHLLHLNILQYPMILLADSVDPDQTARMRRLIWAFAVRICQKMRFRVARPI